MGDEVCIWRNAEVLTKRCHFPCSIINLPIPSADGITAYQQLMWEVKQSAGKQIKRQVRH